MLKHQISLSQRNYQGFRYLLFAMLTVLSMASICRAIEISSGTAQRHERYYEGADREFLAPQFDWSGVGRSVGPGRTPWATMIAPSYFISASHFAPAIGEPIFFNHTNDPNGPSEQHTRASGLRLGNTDSWLGKLATPVSENVAKYAIYPLLDDFSDYQNKELYVVGRSPFSNPAEKQFDVAIGRNRIDLVRPISNFNEYSLKFSYDPNTGLGFSPDEARIVTGDSGAPSFILESNRLGLVSTHWTIAGSFIANDAFLPSHLNTIRSVVEAGGESLVTFIPDNNLGDFDVDLDVDGADFLLWQRGGASGNLAEWQTNYGADYSSLAATEAVPEPNAILMMVICGLLWGGVVRRSYS